jgi:hypothetical protein
MKFMNSLETGSKQLVNGSCEQLINQLLSCKTKFKNKTKSNNFATHLDFALGGFERSCESEKKIQQGKRINQCLSTNASFLKHHPQNY